MPSDEDYEWTISPPARKQLLGVLNDLDKLFSGIDTKDGWPLAAATLISMSIERAAIIQVQGAEKLAKDLEIMKMQGGPKMIQI